MAAVSFVGVSNLITTNGGVPTAITPNASTATGDLLIFYHYGRATGGNETVSLTGWTQAFQAVTANRGHIAVYWRLRQAGDTTYTATVTNYTSGTTGETILEWIETYRNHSLNIPIKSIATTMSTWASSLNMGPISAPPTGTLEPEDMVVVLGGRFENTTAQTLLTGNSLTWTARTLIDTNLGSDASAVTQNGLNGTAGNLTVTDKTITTTGTAQAGAGLMFIIRSTKEVTLTETSSASDSPDETIAFAGSITESASAGDSQQFIGGSFSDSVTESAAAYDSITVSLVQYPKILGVTSGTDASATTSRVITLPTGIQAGELLALFVTGPTTPAFGTISTPLLRNTVATNVGTTVQAALYHRYCSGTETTITFATASAIQISWVAVRVTAGAKPVWMSRGGNSTAGVGSVPAIGQASGQSTDKYLTLVSFLGLLGTSGIPSAPASGWTQQASVSGGTHSAYVQSKETYATAYQTLSLGSQTASASEHRYNLMGFYMSDTSQGYLTEPFGDGARAYGAGQSPLLSTVGTLSSGVLDAISQGIKGNGYSIKRVTTWFRYSTGTPNVDVVLKLYASSGTFNSNAIPTGSALATSNTVNLSSLNNNPVTSVEFIFPNGYQTTLNQELCITVEVVNWNSSVVDVVRTGSSAESGNMAFLVGSTWTVQASSEWNVIYEYEPILSISESTTATDSANYVNQTVTGSVTESASASDQSSLSPLVLGYSSGKSPAAGTSHTITYPSGLRRNELIVLLLSGSGGVIPSVPSDYGWRSTTQSAGGIGQRISFKYSVGNEGGTTTTVTTSTSQKISYVMLRCSVDSIVTFNSLSTATATSSVTPPSYRGGSVVRNTTILHLLSSSSNAVPSAPSTGFVAAASQAGDADGASSWIQADEMISSVNTTFAPSALTLSGSADSASRTLSLVFSQKSDPIGRVLMEQSSTADIGTSVSVVGYGQSFIGDGNIINRIGINIRRSSSVTGTVTMKIYEHSGTYGTSSVPTGQAIATSTNTIDAANTTTSLFQYEEFIFSGVRTEFNKPYVFTIECSNVAGAGTLQIATAANTTVSGNASISSNLSSWDSVTDPNDIAYNIQVTDDTPYRFKSNFDRASIVSNTTMYGWEAMHDRSIDNLRQTKDVSSWSLSGDDPAYSVHQIVTDSQLGRPVFQAISIADNAATTEIERAQASVGYYDTDDQDDVFHSRIRMKLHPDINWLWQNYTSSMTFFTIWETWIYSAIPKYFPDGNVAGSSRISLNLNKASGAGNPFTWNLTAEYTAPLSIEFNDIWTSSNTSVSVPIGEWFDMDVYIKEGEGSSGKMIIKIRKLTDVDFTTVFDITNTTVYPAYPQINRKSIQPIKVYSSPAIKDYMTTNGKLLSAYYSDFTIFKPNINHNEEYSLVTESISTTLTAGGTVSESSSTSDSISVAWSATASVTESSAASHTQDTIGGITGSVSESSIASETVSVTWSANTSASESSTASESIGITWSLTTSVTEPSTASETVASTWSGTRSVSEASIASETYSATWSATASVSESSASSESLNVTWSANSSATESSSASDTIGVTWSGTRSVSESSAASETYSPTWSATSTITESSAASDSQSSTWSGTRSVTESVVASDTQDFIGGLAGVVTESSASSETVGVTWSGSRDVTDSSVSSDTIGATRSASATVSESSVSQDQISVTATMLASFTESLSTSESLSGSATRNASITESSVTQESISVSRTATTSVSESALSQDSLSASRTANAVVTDGVNTYDALSVILSVSVLDSLTISSTFDGYIGEKISESSAVIDVCAASKAAIRRFKTFAVHYVGDGSISGLHAIKP